MSQDRFEDLTRAFDTTLISRRQMLKGLAAMSAFATFPLLELGRRNLAYAQTTTPFLNPVANMTWNDAFQRAYGDTPYNLAKQAIIEKYMIELYKHSYVPSPEYGLSLRLWALDMYDSITPAEIRAARTVHEQNLAVLGAVPTVVGLASDPRAQLVALAASIPQKAYEEVVARPALMMLDHEEKVAAHIKQTNDVRDMQFFLGSWLREAQEFAVQNPAFREQENLYHVRNLGQEIVVYELPGTFIENKSDVPASVKDVVKKATNADGSIPTKPDGTLDLSPEAIAAVKAAALEALRAECGKLGALSAQELEYLKRVLEPLQKDLKEWMANETAQREAAENRQNKAEAYQLAISGAQSTVYLLSTFVGLVDPKVGKQIDVVGNAFIKCFDAFKTYNDTAANLGKLAKSLDVGKGLLEAASGAILAGNIVGAAIVIVSLFQEEQRPEQMILDQIGALRGQVASMHGEMSERFDRIEAGLSRIYGDIMTQFDKINVELGVISGDVQDAQRALARIESKLVSFERNVIELVRATDLGELTEAINGGLGYRERVGRPMPYLDASGAAAQGTWVYYENKFYTWAVNNASNEAWQDVNGRSTADIDLLDELSKPLEDNIAYLVNYPQTKESLGYGLSETVNFANPAIWALSAQAYAELRREWPLHAKRYDPSGSRNEAVQGAGKDLQRALRRITVKEDTPTGPVPNYALFDWLTANYKDKINLLDEALIGIVRKVLEGVWARLSPKPELEIDFWGDPYQREWGLLYDPAYPSEPQGTLQPIIITSLIPMPFRLADYMGLDPSALGLDPLPRDPSIHLNLSYRPGWTGVTWHQAFGTDHWGWIPSAGYPRVFVIVNYGGTPIRTFYITGSRSVPLADWDHWTDDPSKLTTWIDDPEVLTKHWTQGQELRDHFYTGQYDELVLEPQPPTKGSPPPSLKDQVANVVGVELLKLQAKTYEDTLAALEQGGDPVREQAQALGGAKALLRDFIRLGMTRAFAADDFLRTMLYGSQSLPDNQQLKVRYTDELAWVVELMSRGAGMSAQITNVRVPFKQDANERSLALGETLKGYLDALGSGVYSDSLPLVETSLLNANMIDAIVEHSETEKPIISSPIPAPDSTTTDRIPTIRAKVKDAATNLEKSDIRLSIDGRSVTIFDFDQATDRLKYRPTTKLALGMHTVLVTAQDVWGNKVTKRWSFTVVS